MLVVLGGVFDAAHEDGRSETRILQNTLADQGRDLSRRGSFRKALAGNAARFGELAFLVQRRKRSNSLPPIVTVESAWEWSKARVATFILSGEGRTRRGTDGIGKRTFRVRKKRLAR